MSDALMTLFGLLVLAASLGLIIAVAAGVITGVGALLSSNSQAEVALGIGIILVVFYVVFWT